MPTRKPKREGTAHDFTVTARRVVEQAIGEKLDGSPLEGQREGKNHVIGTLSQLRASKGGKARAEALPATKRKAIAKKAAAARWKRP